MSGGGLSCQDLTFAYRRARTPVIDTLSVNFAAGAVTAVTGPSGSGKSTLLYVLSLLLRPTAGSVIHDGLNLAAARDDVASRWRAREVGFVFQDAMLDPARTVLDNVCEPAVFAGVCRRAAERRAADLLDRFGVAHRADHRPAEISGGQAQRVGLCRALLNSPRLIFGDEPTGNLDSESGDVVWGALTEMARDGATVIVATHDTQRAARCDEWVRL